MPGLVEAVRLDPKLDPPEELMVFLSLARLLLNQTWTLASESLVLVESMM